GQDGPRRGRGGRGRAGDPVPGGGEALDVSRRSLPLDVAVHVLPPRDLRLLRAHGTHARAAQRGRAGRGEQGGDRVAVGARGGRSGGRVPERRGRRLRARGPRRAPLEVRGRARVEVRGRDVGEGDRVAARALGQGGGVAADARA